MDLLYQLVDLLHLLHEFGREETPLLHPIQGLLHRAGQVLHLLGHLGLAVGEILHLLLVLPAEVLVLAHLRTDLLEVAGNVFLLLQRLLHLLHLVRALLVKRRVHLLDRGEANLALGAHRGIRPVERVVVGQLEVIAHPIAGHERQLRQAPREGDARLAGFAPGGHPRAARRIVAAPVDQFALRESEVIRTVQLEDDRLIGGHDDVPLRRELEEDRRTVRHGLGGERVRNPLGAIRGVGLQFDPVRERPAKDESSGQLPVPGRLQRNRGSVPGKQSPACPGTAGKHRQRHARSLQARHGPIGAQFLNGSESRIGGKLEPFTVTGGAQRVDHAETVQVAAGAARGHRVLDRVESRGHRGPKRPGAGRRIGGHGHALPRSARSALQQDRRPGRSTAEPGAHRNAGAALDRGIARIHMDGQRRRQLVAAGAGQTRNRADPSRRRREVEQDDHGEPRPRAQRGPAKRDRGGELPHARGREQIHPAVDGESGQSARQRVVQSVAARFHLLGHHQFVFPE